METADRYYQNEENAERSKIASEELDMLQLALNKLPEDKKEILVLSKYQGMKYKDIADLLDLTESAVKVRIFRALKELKVCYEKLEYEVVKP